MKQCAITGAAEGLGRALALRFAAAGYAITGIDVDPGRAAETTAEIAAAGGTARFILADLAQEAALAGVLAELAAGPPSDVFIHNAGISAAGPFERLPLAAQMTVLDVNLVAPMQLTAGLLRVGGLSRPGAVVFVSSLAHFVSYPGASVYAASKDGLAVYARSLRVAEPALHVLTVFPGLTRPAHARRYGPDNSREARRMPPEKLAELIYRAVQRRQKVLIPGWRNRLVALLGSLLPGLVEPVMRRSLYERLT